MPQNFRTRTVHLRRAQSDLVATWPEYAPEPVRNVFLYGRTYRVADITLVDGRHLSGLLVCENDMLLVPEDEAPFDAIDIATMAATPADAHPDFSITDPECLYKECGETKCIESGNVWREEMFAPPREEKDPRLTPVEEAHEEALDDDRSIYTYSEGIPACWHGVNYVTIVPDGIEVRVRPVRNREWVTMTVRPESLATWREFLACHVTVGDGVRVRDLLRLVDLPSDVAREVYHRIMAHDGDSFRNWVRALDPIDPIPEADTDVEFLEVYPVAYEMGGAYVFGMDVSAHSHILTEDDEDHNAKKGERIAFGVGHLELPTLLDLPVRYRDELVIPESHEVERAYYDGPMRDWWENGEVGPKPPIPTVATIRRSITLRDFLAAFFSEVNYMDDPAEEAGSVS